mmetsp:Transcript_4032/g.9976  ORF Transcript_4032/g.9976 Transcript_4032/m.9976 type:complete len:207 (-) Transcript_4032:364-984(-)
MRTGAGAAARWRTKSWASRAARTRMMISLKSFSGQSRPTRRTSSPCRWTGSWGCTTKRIRATRAASRRFSSPLWTTATSRTCSPSACPNPVAKWSGVPPTRTSSRAGSSTAILIRPRCFTRLPSKRSRSSLVTRFSPTPGSAPASSTPGRPSLCCRRVCSTRSPRSSRRITATSRRHARTIRGSSPAGAPRCRTRTSRSCPCSGSS